MRIRITFSKLGALRYTGHLDLHKIWERATLRAALPLMYSQGFHPHPQIQLAAALPLGFSSRCEVVDIWLDFDESGLAQLQSAEGMSSLQSAVPSGIVLHSIEQINERTPALQALSLAAEFEATLLDPVPAEELTRSLSAVMDAESLPRERRGKSYDLRPLIEELHELEADAEGHPRLFMRLAAREGATGRPEEVLSSLGIIPESTRVERTKLIFKETVTV